MRVLVYQLQKCGISGIWIKRVLRMLRENDWMASKYCVVYNHLTDDCGSCRGGFFIPIFRFKEVK